MAKGKLVRSETKFWQMIGRGTRLCPDLFGPGQDKRFFYVFDFCQNLEFFSQDVPPVEGAVGDSLSARLFKTRLDLVGAIDGRHRAGTAHELEPKLRADIVALLREEVAAMNVDNFIVRPKRKLVETYAQPEAWAELSNDTRHVLAEEIAGCPPNAIPKSSKPSSSTC